MDIPSFAFHEAPDGTITWGSSWKPGSYDPEPVAVEYRQTEGGLWVPHQAWVLDEDGDIDMFDCDFMESSWNLYYHKAGGGVPYVNAWVEPERLRGRMWIAEGVEVTSDGWGGPQRPLSDADLLALGIRRVHGPTPAPFDGAIEGDTFYDERTGERVPDDDGETCCCCGEMFVQFETDLVVVDQHAVDDDEIPGLYRPTTQFWGHGDWVAPLPVDLGDSGDDAICPSCAAETVADFGLVGLVDAWSEDPEAMPDDRRETLLDAVRTRADAWIAEHPDHRATRVLESFASRMAPRFGLPVHEMRMLCDEAGFG